MRDERTLRPKRLRPCECCRRRPARVNPLWRLFLMTEVNCTGNTKSTKGKHRQCLNLLNVAPRAEFGIAVHSIDMAGAREHNRHSEIRTRFLMPDPAALGLSWRWHFQPKVRIFAVERNCRQMLHKGTISLCCFTCCSCHLSLRLKK